MRLTLHTATLHYKPGITVFTALSGAMAGIEELYLEIEGADGFRGVGEVRANIAFLSGIAAEAVPGAIRALVQTLPWSDAPDEVLATLPRIGPDVPALARAVVELALLDGIARRDGVPVAALLGGGATVPPCRSNNCLFGGTTMDAMLASARAYVDEGFTDLKLRLGVESFDADLERLRALRAAVGDGIHLAVDSNGSWTESEAIERLRRMAPFGVSYAEQPTRPGDWAAFEAVARASPIPLMLDEGLRGSGDVERLMRLGSPHLAHLKIAKAGSLRSLVEDARRLAGAGVDCMVGQMNEGAIATAAAVHGAVAAGSRHAELYGAYGLIDDVAEGVTYAGGKAVLAGGTGLGTRFHAERASVLWRMDAEHAA